MLASAVWAGLALLNLAGRPQARTVSITLFSCYSLAPAGIILAAGDRWQAGDVILFVPVRSGWIIGLAAVYLMSRRSAADYDAHQTNRHASRQRRVT